MGVIRTLPTTKLRDPKAKLAMSDSDQEIIGRFPVGYYPLHPNVSLNFQMNRFWNWVGDQQMLEYTGAGDGARLPDRAAAVQ